MNIVVCAKVVPDYEIPVSDFELASGSPGKNAASDGRDLGADIALVGVNGNGEPSVPSTPGELHVAQ